MLDKHCKVLCLILAIVLIAVLIKAVVSKGQLWKGDEEYDEYSCLDSGRVASNPTKCCSGKNICYDWKRGTYL